jgi:membrane-bound metal-dependent hydrolase YbcI (DUF457 family)
MPNVVTHFILTAVIIAIIRDFYFKRKYKENHRKIFPLHYVLIGGIAGILPDLDYLIYYILSFSGFTFNEIHRTFTHNFLFPLILFGLGFICRNIKSKFLSRHNLKLSIILFILSFGSFMHILLDFLVLGSIMPFYPLSYFSFGLNLAYKLPQAMQNSFTGVLDAIILIIWMIYIEVKHKISDFI